MSLTAEQIKIVDSQESKIIVEAKAGSGKTTTLVEFAKRRPFKSFLYIAYNDQIRKSSMKKFFGNTKVHTIHSLAYENIGHYFEEKLTNNLSTKSVIESFSSEFEDKDPFECASAIVQNLNIFFSSKDLNLPKDIPFYDITKKYWDEMQNISNNEVKMIHDGYLKLFQQMKPELRFDYILVDEAQDSNEVMLDIILAQKSNFLFVGDENQEIYGFRNVTNIFKDSRFKDFSRYFLTNSFRFGSVVAHYANFILNKYTNNKHEVVGCSKNGDDLLFEPDNTRHRTIITRTNAHLFDLAVQFAEEGKNVCILGGESFIFSDVLDCYYLKRGLLYRIKNPFIKKFSSYEKFKNSAKSLKDQELKFLIKVVDKYDVLIPEKLDMLKRRLIKTQSRAEITLTTIHKSKGLEFETVELSNDYYSLFSKVGKEKPKESIPYEEINLYYVAITRATERLLLNKELQAIS